MIVLVCGGRNYSDRETVFSVLSELRPSLVVHGACGVDAVRKDWHKMKGADQLADLWCDQFGVPKIRVPASWTTLRLRAGPVRNQGMLQHNPDLVVAFPGDAGTADMVRRARAAGVKVRIVP